MPAGGLARSGKFRCKHNALGRVRAQREIFHSQCELCLEIVHILRQFDTPEIPGGVKSRCNSKLELISRDKDSTRSQLGQMSCDWEIIVGFDCVANNGVEPL